MSEFLRELLNKAKESADALDSPQGTGQRPFLRPGLGEMSLGFSTEPGLPDESVPESPQHTKPGLLAKSGLPREPGLVDESAVVGEPGLPDESVPEPPQHTKPGLLAKSGLPREPGLVDESAVGGEPGLPDESVPEPPQHTKPGLLAKSGLVAEPHHLQLLRLLSASRSQIDILIPDLKPSELRLYHYLVESTFGNPDAYPDHVTEYSQREAMRESGIKSTATAVKAMSVLVKKRLVKWVKRSRKRGQKSLVKVFLPDDFTPPPT
jgi:hypothetical protein